MQRFVVSLLFLVACQVRHPDPPAEPEATPGSDGSQAAAGAAGDMASGSGGAPVETMTEPEPTSCLHCGLSNTCCSVGEECVGERCLAPCAGTRCGDGDELCCNGETPLCTRKVCVAEGIACASSGECSADQVCEPLIERCLPGGPADGVCFHDGGLVEPPPPLIGPRAFDPELLWEHTGLWASSMPLVVQLNDDNVDGKIDDHDVPDVVATVRLTTPVNGGPDSSENYLSYLIALSGDDGRVLWQNNDITLCGDAPAAADLDGDGRVEIVATVCGIQTTRVIRDGVAVDELSVVPMGITAFNNYLSPIWGPTRIAGQQIGGISIADLDADGAPEIIAPPHVFNAKGQLLWTMPEGRGKVAFADLDLMDNQLELIWGAVAYRPDGTRLWKSDADSGEETTPIVARVLARALQPTGPQVMLVSVSMSTFQMVIDVRDGASGAAAQDLLVIPGFQAPTASLPVLGDFDGDFEPDVGLGVGPQYLAVHPSPAPANPYTGGTVLWQHGEPRDATYGAGSTAFDFDGDRTLEIVVAAHCTLRVLAAATGTELWSVASGPNIGRGAAAANWGLPVVADVDGDGHADLLVSSGDSDGWCGSQARSLSSIRVYRERAPGPGWTPARKLWNQYAYSIDNIKDDGEVPRVPVHSWDTHNTYRINRSDPVPVVPVTPLHDRAGMPDLRVSALSARRDYCPQQPMLLARIENQGEVGVPAGVAVTFYEGGPDEPGVRLGAVRTLVPLLAGAATWVELGVSDPPLGDAQTLRFFASVDESDSGASAIDESEGGASAITECDEQNNTTAPYLFACTPPAVVQPGGGEARLMRD